MHISAIILAAGQGARMQSGLAKVLHPLANEPMLRYVLAAAASVDPKQIIVVCGHQAEQVQQTFSNWPITWALQEQQLGTADALRSALPQLLPATNRILLLSGDVPLIQPATLTRLIKNTAEDAIGLLTVVMRDPTGLGRIIRNSAGKIERIVEEKDATDAERAILEINPGIYLFPAAKISQWLSEVSSNNKQKEFYLTDVIAIAAREGCAIHSEKVTHAEEVLGVNTRSQLAMLERSYQRMQAERLMQQGVSLLDPMRLDIRGEVQIAADVTIDINVILEGKVKIASNVYIGPNVYLKDTNIGEGSQILANSVLDDSVVGANCQVGPFARLRPNTVLKDNAKIGNFVETKNSIFAAGSKANHLSYIGDTDVGLGVNFGAGTITCNYDGVNKYRTVIGDNVFVGSDVQLIAPVTIGAGSTIAAGTTVMEDVPPGVLALNPKEQRHVTGWQRKFQRVPKKSKGTSSSFADKFSDK